jgi:hypothetical protein
MRVLYFWLLIKWLIPVKDHSKMLKVLQVLEFYHPALKVLEI